MGQMNRFDDGIKLNELKDKNKNSGSGSNTVIFSWEKY